MDRLCIDDMTALNLPRPDFVALAAELGVGHVGLAPTRITETPAASRPARATCR